MRRASAVLRHGTLATPATKTRRIPPLPATDGPCPAIQQQQQRPAPDPNAGLAATFRHILRHLPQSVVVCTSTAPGEPVPVPHAMTVSSFASVSLSPPAPLVSFNVRVPSRTLDAILATRRFAVHLLRPTAAGRRIADRFSRPQGRGGGVDAAPVAAAAAAVAAPLAAGSTAPCADDATAPPVLAGEGIMFAFMCRLPDDVERGGVVPVRDHVIVIGEVQEIADEAGGRAGRCVVEGDLEADGDVEVDGGGDGDGDEENAWPLAIAYGHGRYWRHRRMRSNE